MNGTYGKLVLFRAVTVAINLFLVGQLSIPFDFIAMLVGLCFTASGVRTVIFALEVLNLMLALLGFFFGNWIGSFLGVAISAVCLYVICLPEVKERFQ